MAWFTLSLRPALLALALAAFAFAGCSGPDRAPLKGQVFYKDKPLSSGIVLMQPEKGGQFARGPIQSDGSFEMGIDLPGDGARIGKNLIAVKAYEGSVITDPTKGELGQGMAILPARYDGFGTTPLNVEVKPEGNEPLILKLTD